MRNSFEYKQGFNSLYGDINCFLNDSRIGPSGCVSLDIGIDYIKQGKPIKFKDLLVPSRIENNGIGTYLMLTVIDYVRNAKEFFEIKNTVILRGWLSVVDAENGNWNISLPLYHKVGELTDIGHYFEAYDENHTRYSNPAEFYSHANKTGGVIVYQI